MYMFLISDGTEYVYETVIFVWQSDSVLLVMRMLLFCLYMLSKNHVKNIRKLRIMTIYVHVCITKNVRYTITKLPGRSYADS